MKSRSDGIVKSYENSLYAFSSSNHLPTVKSLKVFCEFSCVVPNCACVSTFCDKSGTRIAAPRRTRISRVCWANGVSCKHCRIVDTSIREWPRLLDCCWLPSAADSSGFLPRRRNRRRSSVPRSLVLFPLPSPRTDSPLSVGGTSSGTGNTNRWHYLASTSALENT